MQNERWCCDSRQGLHGFSQVWVLGDQTSQSETSRCKVLYSESAVMPIDQKRVSRLTLETPYMT